MIRATKLIADFAKRRHVVENPKSTAMRRDNQIAAMNPKITHGSVGEIQLQRLPMLAAIERDPYGIFSSSKNQVLTHRIFAYRVNRTDLWKPFNDQFPGLAGVVSTINIWMFIVDAKAAD